MKKVLFIGENYSLFQKLSKKLGKKSQVGFHLKYSDENMDYSHVIQEFDAMIIANFTHKNNITNFLNINQTNDILCPILLISDEVQKNPYASHGVVSILKTTTSIKKICDNVEFLLKNKLFINDWKHQCENKIISNNKEYLIIIRNLIDELIRRKKIEKHLKKQNKILSANINQNYLRKFDNTISKNSPAHSFEMLHNNNQLYEMIVENTNNSIFISVDNHFLFTNKHFRDKIGYTIKEVTDLNPLNLIYHKDKKELSKIIQELKFSKAMTHEIRIITKDKNLLNTELFLKTLSFHKTDIIFGVVHDITNRIIYEKELVKAKQEAEMIATTKMNFLSQISHELRTPLSAMLGFTDLLKVQEDNDSKILKLERIKQSGKLLLEIINDLIQISYIDSGQISVNKEKIVLMYLVSQIEEIYSIKCNQKYLEFKINTSDNLPKFIYSDTKLIFEIFDKLMNNAIKFTQNGLITINIKSDEESVSFEIIDTGVGIPAEKLDDIFNNFTQISIDYSRKFNGTGLGLSIVKKLLDLLEGSISVKSKIDKGSKFIVSFPVENKK